MPLEARGVAIGTRARVIAQRLDGAGMRRPDGAIIAGIIHEFMFTNHDQPRDLAGSGSWQGALVPSPVPKWMGPTYQSLWHAAVTIFWCYRVFDGEIPSCQCMSRVT